MWNIVVVLLHSAEEDLQITVELNRIKSHGQISHTRCRLGVRTCRPRPHVALGDIIHHPP